MHLRQRSPRILKSVHKTQYSFSELLKNKKSEARISKSETSTKYQNSSLENSLFGLLEFWKFEFVSNFGIWISNLTMITFTQEKLC